MNEAALQNLTVALCKLLHLAWYHTHISIRAEPGFPDLVIVGARGALYRELKSAKGRCTPEQVYWGEILVAAGCDYDVWRPVDWPDRITAELTQLGRVRSQRPLPSQAEIRRRVQRRGARAH